MEYLAVRLIFPLTCQSQVGNLYLNMMHLHGKKRYMHLKMKRLRLQMEHLQSNLRCLQLVQPMYVFSNRN